MFLSSVLPPSTLEAEAASPSKCPPHIKLNDVTSQKTTVLIFTFMETSDLIGQCGLSFNTPILSPYLDSKPNVTLHSNT